MGDIEDAIKIILENIGENLSRNGLKETPKRVAKSYKELFSGYSVDDKQFYKTFETENNNIVILKNIDFTSFCEHHILPFSGIIHIAYIPNGRVIGLSKLARIVDCFSRRLQIQEKLVEDIANSIQNNLIPKGIIVYCKASHQCISCRGIKKSNTETITFSRKGCFNEDNYFNNFLKLI